MRTNRLLPLLLIVLFLSACNAETPVASPPTEPAQATTPIPADTATAIPPETVLPPVVLATATNPPPTRSLTVPANPGGAAPLISISPAQGGVNTSAVQVIVKGSGFAPGASIQINVAPEVQAGQPGQAFTVSTIQAGSGGGFEVSFVMPSDQPDIAQAARIKVIAAPSDGSRGAEAEFTNTDGQSQAPGPALDYTNPVFGFRFTIPAGWHARQSAGAIDFVGLYNPGDKNPPGAEPIVIRAMPSPQTIDGKPVNGMKLQDFARVAFPVEVGIVGQAELKSLQPLQPASGTPAFQAVWHIGGANPSDTIITYFDFNRTVNGQYYRAIEATYDPQAKRDAEYSAVVNLVSIVPVKTDAAAAAARSTAQQFVDSFIAGNSGKVESLLVPALGQRVAAGSTSLPTLLGIQGTPSKFTADQAATFTYAGKPYAVVKGTLTLAGVPAPIQFQLIPGAGSTWLIDTVIPLQ